MSLRLRKISKDVFLGPVFGNGKVELTDSKWNFANHRITLQALCIQKQCGPRPGQWKWYISPFDYPEHDYPHYIIRLYLIPDQLYKALVTEPLYQSIPMVPFEDVYISGVLREKAGVPVVNVDMLKFCFNPKEANLSVYSRFVHVSEQTFRWLWRQFGEN